MEIVISGFYKINPSFYCYSFMHPKLSSSHVLNSFLSCPYPYLHLSGPVPDLLRLHCIRRLNLFGGDSFLQLSQI